MVRHTGPGKTDMAIDKTLTHEPRYVEGHGLLDGRTVVVTAGAGGGIGRSAAQRCLEEGARAGTTGGVPAKRLDGVREELSATFGDGRVPPRCAMPRTSPRSRACSTSPT